MWGEVGRCGFRERAGAGGHLACGEEGADEVDGGVLLLAREERVGGPVLGAGAARAADAVRVVVESLGRLEVDDCLECGDVEPARGDVGGDEDRRCPALEARERLVPLRLRRVAVDERESRASRGLAEG